MTLPEWLQAEITRRAEADRLARKAAYDKWAAAYGTDMTAGRPGPQATERPRRLHRRGR